MLTLPLINSGDKAGCARPLVAAIAQRKKTIVADNINLEQVIRSDLSLDPLVYTKSDVSGLPASGCINSEGISATCNQEPATDQVKPIKPLQIEPIKPAVTLDLEHLLETADNNQLAIVNLKDGQVLPYPQSTVQIKARWY